MTAAPRHAFTVELPAPDDPAVITVGGELDVATAPVLRSALALTVDQGRPDIVIDAGRVTLIDASGIGVLVDGATLTRAEGGSLTVRSPSALLRRVLDLTQVSDLLLVDPCPTVTELAEALAADALALLALAGTDAVETSTEQRVMAALAGRATIARAQGLLMERHGLDVEAADALLHRSSRRAGVSVLHHAESLVATGRVLGSDQVGPVGRR